MALMDALKEQNKAAESATGTTAAPVADKSEKKAKARERKAEKKEALNTILEWAKKQENAPQNIKDALDKLKTVRTGGTAFGPSVFNVLFGDTPKVGDSLTALAIFEKTGKGHAEMKHHLKKWAEKGNVVEFDAATKSYKVVKLA